jgi:hypothetical protein
MNRSPVVSLGIFFRGIRQCHLPGVDFSVTHSLTHSPSHTKRIIQGHNWAWQTFPATSCRLIHNINVAHLAECPHALREVKNDGCQIKISILYKADWPQNLGTPHARTHEPAHTKSVVCAYRYWALPGHAAAMRD